MATDGRYVVSITNDAVASTNYAQVSWDTGNVASLTPNRVATQLTYYLAYGTVCAVNTRITGVTFEANGAAGAVPCTFDSFWWSALQAAFPAYGAPAQTAFGFAFGSGSLTPLGTSITCLEDTGVPGRRSTGRKYLPYVSTGFVTAAGILNATAVANIGLNYKEILIDGAGGAPGVNPSVKSKFPLPTGTEYAITGVRIMPTLANLRRRRR